MKKLSLVVIAKNESRCIKRCLESVQGIVDEMIVVDTGSDDDTKIIAQQCGAKVFDFKWQNDFSKARNYALDQSTGDWNLVLDADEWISKIDRSKLHELMNNEHCVGNIKIINEIHSDEECQYSILYLIRLFPKSVRYKGAIHEQPISNLTKVDVPIEVYHDGYIDQNIKAVRNTRYLLEELKKDPKNSYILYKLACALSVQKKYKEADTYFERFYELVPSNANYRASGIMCYIENSMHFGNFVRGHHIIESEEVNLQYSSNFYFICAMFYREYVLVDVQRNITYLPYVEQCYLECLKLGDNEKENGTVGAGTYLAAYNLGVWYEVTKRIDQAIKYYIMAGNWGYKKAIQRIEKIKQNIR